MRVQNLFSPPTTRSNREVVDTLLEGGRFTLERIVSSGQATRAGLWYDQPRDEWVVLLTGSARLMFEEGDEQRALRPGDYVLIPAHCRHRVEWTDQRVPSVWLALHFDSV